MEYAYSRGTLGRNTPGIAVVVALHVLIGWALVSGLARKVVEVIKAPLETRIIEEIKKPLEPPPPPPPPPKLAAPPPPFIPPPEINIQAPPPAPTQTIATVTTAPPPPGPPPVAAAQPAPQPAPPAPQPVVRREYKAAYRVDPAFPRKAQTGGIGGRVVAHVHVAPAGNVTEVRIVQSTNVIFDREVIRALSQWKFNPEPVGFIGEYEIVFNLKD